MDQLVQYEFVGFEPSYDIRSFISVVADRIHRYSPSDSFMKVAMRKGRSKIRASCRIASAAGVFVVETACGCPMTAIQQIEKKLRQQLNEWKQSRFGGVEQPGLPATRMNNPHLKRRIRLCKGGEGPSSAQPSVA